MSNFFITGVSGTGKSTLAEELGKRNVAVFDIDSVPRLCHWRNRATHEKADYQYGIGKDWLDAHEWICDVEKLKKLLDGVAGNAVVVGLASNQDDFLNLFDKIFLLRCKRETFLSRLSTRDGDNQFAKEKSEQEHILSWYEDFETKTIKQGAAPLDTDENSPVKIADKIIAGFAKEFAAKKFKAAGTGNHFLEVYRILGEEFGVNDEEVLIAGILHDTLEDTDTTRDEIEGTFSKRVADLVEEVSHPKNYNHEQRLAYYEKLKHISPGAKMIKLADFTSHLRSFIKIYEIGKQDFYPKFANNDKYIAQIRDFLRSCDESDAKKSVLKLTNKLETHLPA
jgi:broad-specificity NMP kinase